MPRPISIPPPHPPPPVHPRPLTLSLLALCRYTSNTDNLLEYVILTADAQKGAGVEETTSDTQYTPPTTQRPPRSPYPTLIRRSPYPCRYGNPFHSWMCGLYLAYNEGPDNNIPLLPSHTAASNMTLFEGATSKPLLELDGASPDSPRQLAKSCIDRPVRGTA